MLNKKYFRVKKDSGAIFEFSSINPNFEENLDENGDVIAPEDSDHSYWVNYDEEYTEYEEDSVQKAMWTFSIKGTNYGDLESLKIGAIYRPSVPRLLPNVDFGTENPNYYVFDFELNEWKSPIFDLDGIKIWNTEKKEYVSLSSN
jgi:hypothetical protein